MGEDYIRREDAIGLLEAALDDDWEVGYAVDRMSEIPAVDVRPVGHGHWINHRLLVGLRRECSICGHNDSKSTAIKGKYCWYCGSLMDEDDTEADD